MTILRELITTSVGGFIGHTPPPAVGFANLTYGFGDRPRAFQRQITFQPESDRLRAGQALPDEARPEIRASARRSVPFRSV
jgi:hypothetical protein